MTNINKSKVEEIVKKIIKERDLSTVSKKKIRRLVEAELDYDPFTLDEPDNKAYVSELTDSLVEAKSAESIEGDTTTSPQKAKGKRDQKDEPTEPEKTTEGKSDSCLKEEKQAPKASNEPPNKKPKIDRAKKIQKKTRAKIIDSDSAPDCGTKEDSDSVVKKQTINSPKKEILQEALTEPQPGDSHEKGSLSSSEDQLLENLSELEDDAEIKSNSKPKPKPRAKGKSKAASEDPTAAKITQLKMFVSKCGVRKPWKKLHADLSPSQQVKHIQEVLRELGMKGRPSLEQCKRISIMRELEQEQEALSVDNIIDTGRRPRRACTKSYVMPTSSDEEKEEEKEEGEEEEEEEGWSDNSMDEPVRLKKQRGVRSIVDESPNSSPQPEMVTEAEKTETDANLVNVLEASSPQPEITIVSDKIERAAELNVKSVNISEVSPQLNITIGSDKAETKSELDTKSASTSEVSPQLNITIGSDKAETKSELDTKSASISEVSPQQDVTNGSDKIKSYAELDTKPDSILEVSSPHRKLSIEASVESGEVFKSTKLEVTQKPVPNKKDIEESEIKTEVNGSSQLADMLFGAEDSP